MPFGFVRKHPVGQHISNRAFDIAFQLSLVLTAVITFGMLGRDNNGSASNRLAILITQRDLALAVRLKKRRSARVSVSSEPLQNLVTEIERCRHQIRRFIGCIAEHDALVARALVLVTAGIDALRDFGRLAVQVIFKGQRFPVEAVLLIANLFHSLANGLFNLVKRAIGPCAVFINALAADLSGKNHALSRRQRFAGNTRLWVFGEKQIDNRIRNLVRNLVRMAFGNAFGCEEIFAAHRFKIPRYKDFFMC